LEVKRNVVSKLAEFDIGDIREDMADDIAELRMKKPEIRNEDIDLAAWHSIARRWGLDELDMDEFLKIPKRGSWMNIKGRRKVFYLLVSTAPGLMKNGKGTGKEIWVKELHDRTFDGFFKKLGDLGVHRIINPKGNTRPSEIGLIFTDGWYEKAEPLKTFIKERDPRRVARK